MIGGFVQSLPFKTMELKGGTVDSQPSGTSGGFCVCITGTMIVSAMNSWWCGRSNVNVSFYLIQADGKDRMCYTHFFHLVPTKEGSFYIFNEMFRVI